MNQKTLFSSRDFDLLLGEPSFHNPVHLEGRWHWLVDLTFGAWALRIITRARAANDATPAVESAFAAIMSHLADVHGDQEAALVARSGSPVALSPIPAEIFDLNHFGPKWASYDRDAGKYRPDALAPSPAPAAVREPEPATKKPSAPDVRPRPRRYAAAGRLNRSVPVRAGLFS